MIKHDRPSIERNPSKMAYQAISQYGLIGNMYTAALVAMNGSIDWFCMPYFDSPSVFARMLDDERGGFFRIAPKEQCKEQQFYYPETNVLITRFLHPDGVGELADFMPVTEAMQQSGPPHYIFRRLTCVRGEIRFGLCCAPAFDYGRASHEIQLDQRGAIFRSGKNHMALISPSSLHVQENRVETELVLHEGETQTFVLNYSQTNHEDLLALRFYDEEVYERTIEFWHRWLNQCTYSGRWRETVYRSALILKLLTFEPTGAIVAAPTTSLPEELGGVRNWDYRYTWIRDASFTVYGLLRIGFVSEVSHFMQWLFDRIQEAGEENGQLKIMYRLDGGKVPLDQELPHFSGYRDSKPVRIGNSAAEQLQIDIYGELMDAVYLYNKYGDPISYNLWESLEPLLNWVCHNWRQKDQGLWEVRSKPEQFVFSKVMCWVALDRAIRLAQKRSFPADISHWLDERNKIYREVMEKGWNKEMNTFVQHYDSHALDASNLIMPMVFFLAPTDPRLQGTLDATLKHLVSDSLVFRYLNVDDGLSGGEGTFCMCSFWLVEALTRAGRVAEARLIFEKMLSYANHLGLYSEEISPTGDLIGNFPQAFSHFALISAAFNLNRTIDNARRKR